MKRARRLVLALVMLSGAAHAQNDKALAKDAYDRGTEAHGRGDFRRAAEEFARADALAPSPVALQAALDAAVEADDPVLGAELLQRSKRAPPTPGLAASIDAATKKLGDRAGRVHVTCPGGSRCVSTIDGAPVDATAGAWVRVGPHKLVVQVDGTPDTRTIEVRGGEQMEIMAVRASDRSPAAPPPAAPAPSTMPSTMPSAAPGNAGAAPANAPVEPARRKALPPVVVWVGAGATVVLAGASTWFALSAKGDHDDFVANGCERVATGSCVELKDGGEGAQSKANIGFAVTAAAGVATVILAAFFVDWDRAAKAASRAPVVVPLAGGMAAGYAVHF